MTAPSPLAAALVKALANLTTIGKDREVDTGKYSYSYATLGSAVELTRPILAAEGLVALTPIHDHGDGLACTVKILHVSGETLDLGPFPFPHGRDAQATGSMVTYHRRYALLSALGMATGEDDDGAGAVAKEDQAPPPADRVVSAANAGRITAKIVEAGLEIADVVRIGTGGRTDNPAEVYLSEVAAVREAMDNLTPAPGEELPA